MRNPTEMPKLEDRNPKDKETALKVYPALINLAIHGQENKWWMLYIYLVANSILLLSCATVFAAQNYDLGHKVFLSALCGAGILIAIPWGIMAADYVKASNLYGDIAADIEKFLPDDWCSLRERSDQRVRKSFLGTSKFIAITIPILFALLFGIILVLGWRPCFSHGT